MLDLLFWAFPRFLIAGAPLVLAILAGERAFALVGDSGDRGDRAAPVWMLYAGFAAVSGAGLLPWAMHLEALDPRAFALAALAVALWPLLSAVLRLPRLSLRRSATAAGPVFRHRPAADLGGQPAATALRPATRPLPGRIALGAAEWHHRACAPSLRPMSDF
jgi:hypothetical protein